MTSESWTQHFNANAKRKHVDWTVTPQLTQTERRMILNPLRAWQVGETYNRAQLLSLEIKYAAQTNDFVYVIAHELFIREKQKHGEILEKYLDLIGQKHTQRNWKKPFFNASRYLRNSIGVNTLASLTKDSAAKLFYAGLRNSSHCGLLRQICNDILIDKQHHIEFQTQQLRLLFHKSAPWTRALRFEIYRFFYLSISCLIWMKHRKVLEEQNPSFWIYMHAMVAKFRENIQGVQQRQSQVSTYKTAL